MTRYSSPTSRPLIWEDEAPAESRIRRMQQVAPASRPDSVRPASSHPRPGSPRNASEIEEEDFSRTGRAPRFDDAPPRPWWRPASTVGRVFLVFCALTILGGLTTCALLLRNYLVHDARFRIAGSDGIQAAGLAEVSRAELLTIFGEDIGRNIFFVPLAERRRQLEQIPWVESATVMRFLPDRIRVAVVERRPIAFLREGQQIGLVDANGVLLSMAASTMTQHHYSFPVVTGIDARDPLGGRKARMAVYRRLLEELDSGGQKLSEQISEVDLTDPEDARVLMPEQGGDILAHFGEDHFLERYQRYKAHIAEWKSQYPKLAAVDLRYEQQVVLEMTPGAGGAQAAAGGAKVVDGLDTGKPAPGVPAADSGVKADDSQAAARPEAKPPAKSRGSKPAAAQTAKKKRAEQMRAALIEARRERNVRR